jgi:hypothetical protein
MLTILDSLFEDADMYRAWAFPDLFPGQPQPRLDNWSDEDLWDYCGIRRAVND